MDLNDAFEEFAKAHEEHVEEEAKKLGVSKACAESIVYLRTRSRWTQEAESELARMDKAGEKLPNINEWP